LIRDIHVVLKINTDVEYFIKVGNKFDAHIFSFSFLKISKDISYLSISGG